MHAEIPSKEFVLWKDDLYPDRAIKIQLPLQSLIDPAQLAKDLNLPSYLDTKSIPIRKMLTILWASRFAHNWSTTFPERCPTSPISRPLEVLVFGGAAFKLHCASSNKPNGPFNRTMGDVDFIIPKKRMKEARALFLALDKVCGSEYLTYATPSDTMFNKLRGERLRFHTIEAVENGEPVVGVLDILPENIEMRHTIRVSEEFENVEQHLYTIGLENMLLSKLQYICDASEETTLGMDRSNQSFRILSTIYPHYDRRRIVIGMEQKDMKDVAALFLDHDLGSGADEINSEQLSKILDKDKKLRLTVRLNLQNLVHHSSVLSQFGASDSEVEVVRGRIQKLLDRLPVSEEKYRKPWWNTDVETPQIS